MPFKDHFSVHARDYAAARPGYPEALFDWLAELAPARRRAWDAGCGNGQAALALAARFEAVVATDPSAGQIAAAAAHPRIDYRVEPAETPSLAPASVDLVVVAQALHWFDAARFHAAVKRVACPGGIVAAWTYGASRVTPAVDRVFDRLYAHLDADWPPERRHVESGYRSLPFPWPETTAPPFEMGADWTLGEYLAYLGTWSASQRHLARTGVDPVAALAAEFGTAWGEQEQRRRVRWPLALRVGRVGD